MIGMPAPLRKHAGFHLIYCYIAFQTLRWIASVSTWNRGTEPQDAINHYHPLAPLYWIFLMFLLVFVSAPRDMEWCFSDRAGHIKRGHLSSSTQRQSTDSVNQSRAVLRTARTDRCKQQQWPISVRHQYTSRVRSLPRFRRLIM